MRPRPTQRAMSQTISEKLHNINNKIVQENDAHTLLFQQTTHIRHKNKAAYMWLER